MLSLFMQNRKGSITIMLSFLLISVLSINSTFLETSRYRGMERLYKEIEENAAFSTLSKYDRDLFSEYGLLALSQEVNKDTFLDYLKNNINYDLDGANGVDKLLEIVEGDISFEKLYSLNQEEVFAMQINEFCAYRAPASYINNTLNIEEIVKDLVKDLEDSIPILKILSNLCKSAEKIFDTFLNLSDYKEKCQGLEEQHNEYKKRVDEFNAAVKERDDYINAEHEEDEDYEGILKSKCDEVKAKAADVRDSIKSTESALGEFYESYKKFVNAFDSMQGANIKSMLSSSKADIARVSDKEQRENTQQMLENMEKAYKNSEDMCTSITKRMDQYKEDSVRASVQRLDEQWELLEGEGDALGSISYAKIEKADTVWDTVRLVTGSIEQLVRLVEEWVKTFSIIGDMLDLLSYMSTYGVYDIKYDSVLSGVVTAQLPGRQHNGNRMISASNPYESADESMVNSQIAKTQEVAANIGFDTGILNQSDKENENMLLQQAMDRMLSAEAAFRAECESLKSTSGLVKTLLTLIKVVRTLMEFIDSLLNLINVFSHVAATNILQEALFQKFNPAIYATEMFSNRTTDVSADKKLNGSSFPDNSRFHSSSDDYFEMADTEYILYGSDSEITNQTYVFTLMLVVRMLCNVPALLMNETVMDMVEALCESLIGAIGAIILMLVVLLVEAWLDMLFMVYGRDKVDIIKINGYLDLEEGTDELKKKAENLIKNMVPKEESEKKAGKAEDYAKGLFQWGYKDHLLLLLILFVPSKAIYARSADLIEMQMKHKKAISGESFKLSEMATYMRIESTVTYKPLLPIPMIPGLNDDGLKIKNIHYSGY